MFRTQQIHFTSLAKPRVLACCSPSRAATSATRLVNSDTWSCACGIAQIEAVCEQIAPESSPHETEQKGDVRYSKQYSVMR